MKLFRITPGAEGKSTANRPPRLAGTGSRKTSQCRALRQRNADWQSVLLREHLETLETFSKPSRALWDVRWIDEDLFDFTFQGRETIYRYWDATQCVEFGFRMAEQALDVHLRQETDYLARLDRISEAVNAEYDARNSDLHVLIASALQHGGVVSKNRRRQFAERVQSEVFDFIEELAKRELRDAEEPPPQPR